MDQLARHRAVRACAALILSLILAPTLTRIPTLSLTRSVRNLFDDTLPLTLAPTLALAPTLTLTQVRAQPLRGRARRDGHPAGDAEHIAPHPYCGYTLYS